MATNPISAPILVLCEGSDEKEVLPYFAQHWFAQDSAKFDFESMAGLDENAQVQFRRAVDELKIRPKFQALVRVVVFAFDAEEEPESTLAAMRQIGAALEEAGKACFFALSPDQGQGGFETRFKLALAGNDLLKCASDFVVCARKTPDQRLTTKARQDKVAVMAWFAAASKNPYSRVGVALAQSPSKGLIDPDHSAFASIKAALAEALKKAS